MEQNLGLPAQITSSGVGCLLVTWVWLQWSAGGGLYIVQILLLGTQYWFCYAETAQLSDYTVGLIHVLVGNNISEGIWNVLVLLWLPPSIQRYTCVGEFVNVASPLWLLKVISVRPVITENWTKVYSVPSLHWGPKTRKPRFLGTTITSNLNMKEQKRHDWRV